MKNYMKKKEMETQHLYLMKIASHDTYDAETLKTLLSGAEADAYALAIQTGVQLYVDRVDCSAKAFNLKSMLDEPMKKHTQPPIADAALVRDMKTDINMYFG
jgi:hypothetical protein